MQDGTASLASVGVTDGCVMRVTSSVVRAVTAKSEDIPLDVPTVGNTSLLYERVAERLGIKDASRMALFSGTAPIYQDADLSGAPLADGFVLATYVKSPLRLPFTVLPRCSATTDPCVPNEASSSSSGSAGHADSSMDNATELAPPSSVQCFSSDTIDEVRERIASTAAPSNKEHAAHIRASKVFVADCSAWDSHGSSCKTLSDLSRLLGHFVPCSEQMRVSRLGIAEGFAHLVLVQEQHFLVEVQVHTDGDVVDTRKLRVGSTWNLSEVGKLLERELREAQLEVDLPSNSIIQWAVGNIDTKSPARRPQPDPSARAQSPRLSMVAAVSSAAAAVVAPVKRKSFGGSDSTQTPNKRRSLGSKLGLHELSVEEFVGDVHAAHSRGPKDLPPQFLCPISYDLMRDPVVVSGSGNTYDRKSIERHLQMKHTDPMSNQELRRASERKLVPNNALRSQVNEAERSQVNLQLIAFFGDHEPTSDSGESGMSAYFRRFKSAVFK
jgi:hypothetical protein